LTVVYIIFDFNYSCVNSCGIITHIEISYRAQDLWNHRPKYQQLVRKHQDALQGGSPYPDVMYDEVCYKGSLHSVAEDTHWYPFMKTAISYLRKMYPPPITEDGEKLLVFLLAVGAHQVSDVVWHASLTGCPNGFIDGDAWNDFHDDRSAAHSSVDPGGDSICDYELPIGYIGLVNRWYVPSEHLQSIYKQYADIYHSPLELNATAQIVEICSDLMFIGRFFDDLFLGVEYPKYSKNNTFLLEELYDYYYGGIENMARETVRYWDSIIDMYEFGTDICADSDNPYYLNCSSQQYSHKQQQSIAYVESKARNTHLPFTQHSLPLLSDLKYTNVDTGLISNQSYADFGHSSLIADFNNDSFDDLAVSAPNYYILGCPQGGRVFIIYGQKGQALVPERNISIIEQLADQTLISPSCDGDRFGTSLTTLDWNKDGFNDLVISSPSRKFGFKGSVFIFSGGKNGLEPLPSVQIDGVNEHDTVGWNIQGAHLDNDQSLDLIISSPFAQKNGYDQPQQGVVWIFLNSIGKTNLTVQNATYTIWGEIPKSKFGYSITIVPTSCTTNEKPILMISAPNYVLPDTPQSQGVGKVYAYTISEQGPQLVFSVTGNDMDHFGHSLSIEKQHCTLAVGAPTSSTDWEGAVILLSLPKILKKSNKKKSLSLNDIPPLAIIVGELRFQRLGTTVHWTNTYDLVLTAPLGKSLLASEGRAYIIEASRIPLTPTSEPISITKISSKTLVADNRINRFGTHSNILSSPSMNLTYFTISSPFTPSKEETVRLPGALYFYKL
ncbi:unnamed protein product, partial [Didymodactylos carnosus]